MAELNIKTTVNEIYNAFEKKLDQEYREHLGGSNIGRECQRELWYTFRWCTPASFHGRILKLFDRGQLEENRFISDLRSIGCHVWNLDPKTNQQYRVNFLGGHLGGSLDGIGKGIIEAPKNPHILEFKTHDEKSFKLLLDNGVSQSKPEHYSQCQLYMHGSNQFGGKRIERALYLAVNKNTDELFSERIHYKPEHAALLVDKAKNIIESPEPLTGISENPTFYKCKFCNHQSVCHYDKAPAVNCRTCIHATPHIDDGTWTCNTFNKTLNKQNQLSACDQHLFIPSLISFGKVKSISDESTRPEWIAYTHKTSGIEFKNYVGNQFFKRCSNPNEYTSNELNALDHTLIGDPTIKKIKQTFNKAVIEK